MVILLHLIASGESGTLSESAVVTHGEMIEHSFYQGLNLWQAMYLHSTSWLLPVRSSNAGRLGLLLLVTLPWAARRLFPVNSFSANWKANGKSDPNENRTLMRVGNNKHRAAPTINSMYFVKKWQYVFYKHVILHGLNVSMALVETNGEMKYRGALPLSTEWRVFWLCLNTSYVIEFFLQSLVKRRDVISQRTMLLMNALLMASSSLAASTAVFGAVRWEAALVSVLLNFGNRGRDVVNTMATAALVYIFA